MLDSDLKNAKILLVDDQQANIEVLKDFLEIQKFTNILTTLDSRTVCDLYTEFEPDMILLDLHMPYISGFDVLEQLKQIIPATSYLPILVLTADITVETKRKALQNGASDFLSKPFDFIELQARVNTHLLIKLRNEQIKQYSDELEMQIAIKDKFFSIIAHDVRNPFIGIKNYINILLKIKNYNPNEVEENLLTIRSSANRGHELLENLLKWSKSQTGIMTINKFRYQLKQLTDSSISFAQVQAANKNIEINNTINEQIFVDTDSDVLDTVLRNLLSNAVKFTPVSGTITVAATKKDGYANVSVTDTGNGIEEYKKEKLFRIDSNLQAGIGTEGESGSGLGLILCKEFINKLDGEIWVESELGKGSSFIFTLPSAH
jgi:signal transduction histidine kinase